MLLCPLLVYFTAGVFIGAPLSFINKQLPGGGQLAIPRGTLQATDNVSEQAVQVLLLDAEVHEDSVLGGTDQQATASIVVLVQTASSEPDITIVVHPVEVTATPPGPEAATS